MDGPQGWDIRPWAGIRNARYRLARGLIRCDLVSSAEEYWQLSLTADEFLNAASCRGRAEAPQCLYCAWHDHLLTLEVLPFVIGSVWSVAEYPQDSLPRRFWLEMFRAADYTAGSRPAQRPPASVILWRGCQLGRQRRMSWTSDRAIAERFATAGIRGRLPGVVYRTEAKPSALLCANESRNESEVVVDPRELVIDRAV
jgi:hypothetical protein